MSALNYSEVNGHTNVFWGWGREDSDIEHRIHAKHMKIEKPEIFDSGKIQKYCPRGPLTLIIKDPVSPFGRSLLNIRFISSLFEHKFIFERSSSLTLNRSLSLMWTVQLREGWLSLDLIAPSDTGWPQMTLGGASAEWYRIASDRKSVDSVTSNERLNFARWACPKWYQK